MNKTINISKMRGKKVKSSISKISFFCWFFELLGDIYEHAVVLSVKTEDQDAFERDFFQLKPYYTDAW